MADPKPSLELLRGLSDARVLRAFLGNDRLTRAQVATITALSKPTVSQSVRRLVELGLVADTGERTTGRGAAGTYFAFVPDCAAALVASIEPRGIIAEVVDPTGSVRARASRPVARDADANEVDRVLSGVAKEVDRIAGLPIEIAVVSAADPVDKESGRVIDLPDAAFLVGPLDPIGALGPLVAGTILVGNDVNWAAVAEHNALAVPPSNFAYLYLGEGLGCAVIADDEVRVGNRGLVGEISHILVNGPDGDAVAFTRAFETLNLHHEGTAAVDVERLLANTSGTSEHATATRASVARAVVGVITSMISLWDPDFVIVGGPWGSASHIHQAVIEELAVAPRSVEIRSPLVADEPGLAGARIRSVNALEQSLVTKLVGDEQVPES